MRIIYLVLAGHGFDSRDLSSLRVFPSRRSDVNHGVVLQLVGAVEDAPTVVSANHREFPILKFNQQSILKNSLERP